MRRLIGDFSIKPGERAVVLGSDDETLAIADELEEVGIEVSKVVDLRAARPTELVAQGGKGRVSLHKKILDYRTEHGAVSSVDELDAIPGIGPSASQSFVTSSPRDGAAAALACGCALHRHCSANAARLTAPALAFGAVALVAAATLVPASGGSSPSPSRLRSRVGGGAASGSLPWTGASWRRRSARRSGRCSR